jgi:hypothetical protein
VSAVSRKIISSPFCQTIWKLALRSETLAKLSVCQCHSPSAVNYRRPNHNGEIEPQPRRKSAQVLERRDANQQRIARGRKRAGPSLKTARTQDYTGGEQLQAERRTQPIQTHPSVLIEEAVRGPADDQPRLAQASSDQLGTHHQFLFLAEDAGSVIQSYCRLDRQSLRPSSETASASPRSMRMVVMLCSKRSWLQ